MRHTHDMTNSERSSWLTCQFLWFLRYGLRIRPEVSSLPLVLGTIWHLAVDAWWVWLYKQRNLTEGADPFVALLMGNEALSAGFHDLNEALVVPVSKGTAPRWTEDVSSYLKTMQGMLANYHDRYQHQDMLMVSSEEVLRAQAVTHRGRKSVVTGITGKIDKVIVDGFGQHWLIEHKTVGKSGIEQWRNRHDYQPQGATYAWLWWKQTGIMPAGICYDLVLKATAPTSDMFQVLKNESGLMKKFPANTTATALKEAIRYHGFSENDGWYRETLSRLEMKPDPFLQRSWVRFSPEQMKRASRELYSVATQVRRAHRSLSGAQYRLEHNTDTVGTGYADDERDVRRQALEEVEAQGHLFPRNPNSCQMYGGCAMLDLCRHRSWEAMSRMRIADTDHEELAGGA